MGNRGSQFNMAHSFPAHLGTGYFNTAAFTDLAFITDAFIASAVTFPVFHWPENTFAKQAVPFRLQGTVIDGFRFFYFTPRPFPDQIRRSQSDFDRFKHIEFQTRTPLSLYAQSEAFVVVPDPADP